MTETRQAFTFRFESFEVAPQSGELRNAGVRIRLQDLPFRVLVALLEQRGQLVTREELKRRIWPSASSGDFDHAVNVAVAKIRTALSDSADAPRFVETLPRRGYRFIFPVSCPEQLPAGATPAAEAPRRKSNSKVTALRWAAVCATTLLVTALAVGGRLFTRRAELRPRSTIVLGDFTNTTGDSIFDDTLLQGLSVQLEQSPSFRILPDQQIRRTLQMMGRKTDARLTPEIARELCIRAGAEAVINGSIAQIGAEYLVTLNAINCASGELLAGTEADASSKDKVLAALDEASSKIRGKLGESLTSIQKFDTPLAEATTSSLEALKIYSVVNQGHAVGDPLVLMEHAVELDPRFAVAYESLASGYSNMGEAELASEYAQKAYDNREHATERDQFRIDAAYDYATLGNLDEELHVYPVWEQMYPQDWDPWNDSATSRSVMGDYDGALKESLTALRLGPARTLPYINTSLFLLYLNHVDEARQTAQRALERGHDVPAAHVLLYRIAFLRGDAKEMAAQLAFLGKGEPSEGDGLRLQSDTAAYFGRLQSSREFSAQELQVAQEKHFNEISALIRDADGLREAEYGYPGRARQDAAMALELSSGRHPRLLAALALARTGEGKRAQELADGLNRQYGADTMLQTYWLPAIRGAIELARRNPSKALEDLQQVHYELGDAGFLAGSTGNLYPVYLRGEAYLQKRQGREAAAEFQLLVDHRTIVFNSPLGALAHLGLARAWVLQGETGNARAAYQDFLALWKDADADIPVLKEAAAEYAKLR